jgi:hypothetical protein
MIHTLSHDTLSHDTLSHDVFDIFISYLDKYSQFNSLQF